MLKGIVLKFAAASLLIFGAVSLQAQEAKSEKKVKKQAFMETLSEVQKADYNSFKEQKKASKATMEATFSPEQLDILNNTEQDKKAKREALKLTYTDAQKEQHKANKMANRNAKEAFVATLSEEQKALMPKSLQNKVGKTGKKRKKKGQE